MTSPDETSTHRSSFRKRRHSSITLNGSRALRASSTPSNVPCRYSCLRIRSQTWFALRPLSRSVRGLGGGGA